ncbi:thiamine pyrophosphate-dependent enzyme [Methanolobus profundi]|uniref:Indolepyruvate oxidoreductase subunit IorA n=1 Tax=Methanolobus profundi TaxID=487685 RepID=A0A1I4NQY1_9EURY|nr:thiamine pyrophosphate-dependent enzyme [Methanolobus profundi]SFM17836.1 indolepyruvate ferredoxin oxidoreductase alpha subunit [Methanolobus profundi]
MTDKKDITGLEAIYLAALDSNVRFITAVAGYPMTAVIDHFFENKGSSGYDIHWFTNEKAAMEASLGASVTGRRSMVMVKHVGMNLLSDPLMTAMMHTTGAGIVILAGDDPAAKASQNEQDSRFYGSISETAVFDPATPQDAYDSLNRAFELSEEAKVPVIMRITDRLEKDMQDLVRSNTGKFTEGSGQEFDRNIWKLTMHGKHQRFHIRSEPILIHEAEGSHFNRMTINGDRTGIISSGYPTAIIDGLLSTQLVYSGYSHLALGVVSPFPDKLVRKFIDQHERIIVIEESEAFIESHISTCNTILGKKSGHLPTGMIEKEHVEFALENIDKDTVSKYTEIQTIANRGSRPICSDCPFMPLYNVLHDIRPVAGDMGCSIRTAPDPLNAVDTGFALGGAISTACGFPGKGIAVIGDFGLAHSGIIGLINAVDGGFDLLVIILQNEVAAMTGGQGTPDLRELVRALVPDMTIIDVDRSISSQGILNTQHMLKELIDEQRKAKGVSVLYLEGKCIKF